MAELAEELSTSAELLERILRVRAQRKWLATALAARPGQPHRNLGRYRRQTIGYASGVSEDRPCPLCGKPPTRRGYDPCLANLPSVNNACCGHGMYTPYATLTSGFCLRGKALETYLRKVGRLQRFRKMSGLRLRIRWLAR